METYVPMENFAECGRVMQPREALTSIRGAVKILEAHNEVPDYKAVEQYKRHPLVEMWGTSMPLLCTYALTLLEQVAEKPSFDPAVPTVLKKIEVTLLKHLDWATSGEYNMEKPLWLGDERFHLSQKALLFRTDPKYYGPMWPDINTRLDQFWPVSL